MSWLVTGGAGYIGAHVVRALSAAGIAPVVIDDLSSGHDGFVPAGVPFVRGSILNRELVEETLREHEVEGVIHVAGYKYAGVSVTRVFCANAVNCSIVIESASTSTSAAPKSA